MRTLSHTLGVADIAATLADSSGNMVEVDWAAVGLNQITITFATAPAVGEVFTLTVMG